jgi:hypothetical protein
VLSDRDGSWDIRKSYELERRIGAAELFSRIPGARQSVVAEREAEAEAEGDGTPAAAAAAPATPEPEPEPPRPLGPPITGVEHEGRMILRIPADRLDSETVTALGRRALDALAPHDKVTRAERDRMEESRAGFVAPLAFLSEVFVEGKPLDRKRFGEEAVELRPGVRVFEAHLPRYGSVWVVEADGKRWLTSEIGKADLVLGTIKDWAS